MGSEKGLRTSRGTISCSVYKLLKEIEIRPVIWNHEHVNRRNRLMFWHDVIRVFVPFFDEISVEEQNKIYLEVAMIWKSLTNLLMKSIKIKNSGDPKYKPYRYAHHMEFYLNYRGITLDEVGTPAEFEQNDEIERKRVAKNILKANRLKKRVNALKKRKENGIQNFSEHLLPCDSYDSTHFFKTTTQNGFNSQNLDFKIGDEEVNNYNYTALGFKCDDYNDIGDHDQDFYDSIKPIISKLDGAEKINFKIAFLETLKKYQAQNV